MAQVQVLKVRVIEGAIPNSVGGSISISGDSSNRKMTVNVTESVGNWYDGQYRTRTLYDISLNLKSLNDVYGALISSNFLEAVNLKGPSDIPSNFLEMEDKDTSGPSLIAGISGSTGLVGFNWHTFTLDENYFKYSSPYITDSNKLSFYLTSIDPSSELLTTQRSFGKYINTSPVTEGSSLTSKASLYDLSLSVNDVASSETSSIKYIQVNSEIMNVDSYSGNNIYVESRSQFDTINQFHLNDDMVYFLDVNRVFNSSFGENETGGLDQFRCFAVVNNTEMTLSKINISSRENSNIERSNFSFFVEIPMVESFTSVASGGSFDYFDLIVVDSSYVNVPSTSSLSTLLFVGQVVSFSGGENDGQKRVIVSYSPDLERFYLNEDLPYQISVGDTVVFDTAPSSTSYTGTIDPRLTNNGIFSDEIEMNGRDILTLDGLNRSHEDSMLGGDAVYLWIKRSLAKTSIVSDEMPSLDFFYSVT